MNENRQAIQAGQYHFPYHYLPTLDGHDTIAIHRFVHWGLEYLTYMTFVADLLTHQVKPASLVDIGCGDGRLLNMLTGKIPRCVGMDPDERALAFARAFNPGVEFFSAGLAEVPGTFETASLVEVLEHIPDQEIPQFLQGIAQKLVPGGWLVLSVPTKNVKIIPKHYRHYDLETIQIQLDPEFQVKQHWYLVRQNGLFGILNFGLQNCIGIILSRKWRRMIWRLHRRYTFFASQRTGAHLVVFAEKTCDGG